MVASDLAELYYWPVPRTLSPRGAVPHERYDLKRRATIYGRLLIGIGLSFGLGWFSVRGLDWGLVLDNLSNVSVPLIVLALSVFMAAAVLRAARWQMLFLDPQPSIFRLFIVQHEGLGLSNIMPVRVASELTQIAVLTIKDGVKASNALAAIGMERVVDMLSSTLILGIAFVFVPEMRPLAPFVWATIVVAVGAIVAVRVFAWRGESLWLIRRIKFLVALSSALSDLEKERGRLVKTFVASVAYWLLVGVSAWIASEAIGLPVSPLTATLVVIGTIFFSTAVPAAPSAIGTFHFAVVYVLGLVGVVKADAFPFAVIIHLVFFAPPTIIAAIFLPREGISLKRNKSKAAEEMSEQKT
jgi:uncharacterized protein (TIRG00374 family)